MGEVIGTFTQTLDKVSPPGSPQGVAGTQHLFGVACTTSTTCEAVGAGTNGHGAVMLITDGTPGTVQQSREARISSP
jgi:hypothetical protein